MNRKYLHAIDNASLTVGLLLIIIFLTASAHRMLLSRSAVDTFNVSQKLSATNDPSSLWSRPLSLDFSLWSHQRIAAYEKSLSAHFEPPLGILRIRKVRLEVPVLSGDDDLSLNRGVGLIAGTSRPGEAGRIGIAGHRDGFFRVLKDVGRGDLVELETLDRVDLYRVDEVVIVKPDDVKVLYPTASRTLSLVTCYPFYFIGSAPQRYIVTASLERSEPVSGSVEAQPNTTSVRFEPVSRDYSHRRKNQPMEEAIQ